MTLIVDLNSEDGGAGNTDPDNLARIIAEAVEDPCELDPWEYDFIMNVADLEPETLTAKQIEHVIRIGQKYE